MDSIALNTFKYPVEDVRPFVPSSEGSTATPKSDTSSVSGNAPPAGHGHHENAFAPMAPGFHGQTANTLMNLLAQQEARTSDAGTDFSQNGSEINFDEPDPHQQFYMGNTGRPESSASHTGMWNDLSASCQAEQMATFDFLVKSVSAANNFVSMLTRDQLTVLQAMRPELLYDFLQEVAKVRNEKRLRRALPTECAFCKNNGENEECYSAHALKDWRGRVLCPVLRAFRCPRCGATGDRAHTIKYCPENNDSNRCSGGSLLSRRRMPSSLSMNMSSGPSSMPTSLGPLTPNAGSAPPPSPSPNTPMSHNGLWSFGMN